MNEIIIYTDGGCSGNPGPGGWAYVVNAGDNGQITGSGHDKLTTNNKMELTAVIEALHYVKAVYNRDVRAVHVHTDSQYVKNGITTWIHGWIRNGWKTAAKKPVKNQELWIDLKTISDQLPVRWHWVKGHAGIELNELCDSLVQDEIAAARQ